MKAIRSRLFDGLIVVWTAMFIPALGIFILCGRPRAAIRAATRVWSKGILILLDWTVGLTHVEAGRQNVPDVPCLIVANHQSQWETIAFLCLIPNVAIIAKLELESVPVMGWFLRNSPMILIDRESGGTALRQMLTEARSAIDQGRSVLIFPQGSRMGTDVKIEFRRGVELLYRQLGVPAVPVTLNSGQFWSEDAPYKSGGTITVTFLPSIPAGLSANVFVDRAQSAMEAQLRPAGA